MATSKGTPTAATEDASTDSHQHQNQQQTPTEGGTKPYDREAKLKELLEQDEKTSPWADPFMGF